jgi:hypothetical protein
MGKSAIISLTPQLEEAFASHRPSIFSARQVEEIRRDHADQWNLPKSVARGRFLDLMLENTCLQRIRLSFPHRTFVGYSWGDAPIFDQIFFFWPSCYLSHTVPAYLHRLLGDPTDIYINVEQSLAGIDGILSQDSIDRAFRKPQRMPTKITQIGDRRLLLMNGRNTWNLGIQEMRIESENVSDARVVRTTSLERTLIDLAVRPAYVGGPKNVMRAYELAGKRIDVPLIAALLQQLRYTYPFEQAIGFYLESGAGFSSKELALVGKPPFKFDFYLSHGMKETRYIEKWMLHVPLDV